MSYDNQNIFLKILSQKIPSYEIYRDETCIAILDIMPQSNGHILIIPFEHSADIFSLSHKTTQAIILVVKKVATAAKLAFKADGILISQHNGKAAGQSIFHCHFHVIPCYKGIPLNPHNQEKTNTAILEKNAALIKSFLD